MSHSQHDWPEVHGHCVPCLLEKLEAAQLQHNLLVRIRDAYSEGLKGTAAHKCEDTETIFKTCVRLVVEHQELQNEVARFTRNEKCYGCGHSRENHDRGGCLVWVDADAHRKCLCKVWVATGKEKPDTCENYRDGLEIQSRFCSTYEADSQAHAPTCQFYVEKRCGVDRRESGPCPNRIPCHVHGMFM